MVKKLFRLVLLLCTFVCCACADTQSFTYGGSGHDILYEAAVGANGHIVLTGLTDSADGTLASRTKTGRSGWALCIDTEGSVLWNYCTRLGSYDTLRYPVFRADGSVSMLLETSHSGLYEVVWILLDQNGHEISRKMLDSRGMPWVVRAGGIYDAYQSGYVVDALNKKTTEETSRLYTFDGEPSIEVGFVQEPYFPDAVLPDGTRITIENDQDLPLDVTVTFSAPEDAGNAQESGFYTFTDQPPETLAAALDASPWRNANILSGCYDRLNGSLRYAQMILRDQQGYLLLCGVYDESTGWQLEASRQALRQDMPPQLLAIAERDSFTPDTIRAAGGCEFFEIRYPDAAYLWGYQPRWARFVLCEATLKSGERINVIGDTLWSSPAFEHLYHDFGYSLENFDLSRLPASLEEARQRAAAMPQSSRNLGRLMGNDNSLPRIPMYAQADEASAVMAHYMCGVSAEVLNEGDDFTLVRIGSLQGYVPRYNVLIGGERAEMEYDTAGAPGLVYGQAPQPLRLSPDAASDTIHEIDPAVPVEILGRPAGAEYLQIRTQDGRIGFMHDTHVLLGWEDFGGYYTLMVTPENSDSALLYSAPDETSPPIGQCMAGALVGRLVEYEYRQNWQRVIIQGYDGYMRAADLQNIEAFTIMP